MSNAVVLERPAIEDALFGEAKTFDVEGEFTPDACFCICRCRTREVKIPNSQNQMVDVSMVK